MKSLSIDLRLPYVFVNRNDKAMLVPTMVCSTIAACALITFIPQLMPLWMSSASRSWV